MNEDKILQALNDIAKQLYNTADQLMAITGYMVADKQINTTKKQEKQNVVDLPLQIEEDTTMRYGNGCIVKRTKQTSKGNYFYYQGSLQYNNERHYVTAKTKQLCCNKIIDLNNTLKNKTKGTKKKALTFGKWLEQWYNEYKVGTIKESSLANIRNVLNKYITKELKDKNLKLLKPLDLQKCLNGIESTRMKQETVKVFTNSLKYAKINGHIKTDIMQGVTVKKHEYKTTVILTKEQQQLLIDRADPLLKNCILGYLWTGCRRNELLAIKKEDCDLINNTIHIKGTKTKSSNRIIPIFNAIKEIIINTSNNEYVFKNFTHINARFKTLCDSLSIENITIHSLRHTFATNCMEMGINIKTTQKWLGHSKMSTTSDIYLHLSNEQEQKDIDKMNNL